MSVATFSIHSPWVKGTVRFLGAIAIPVGIVWAFMSAQHAADDQYTRETQVMKDHPTAQGSSVTDYELKEVDDTNTVKWQLVAKSGKSTEDNKIVDIEGVTMKFFDGPNVKMSVTAPLGNVNAETRYVKLGSRKGQRVKGDGDSGKSTFSAETIELDKNNQFFATGGVIIEWTEVAKVTGNEARGKLDKGSFQDVKVVGHTHAVIAVK